MCDCCSLCGCSQWCPQLCPQLCLSPSLALITSRAHSFPCPSTYCCSHKEAVLLPLPEAGHAAFSFPNSHNFISEQNLQFRVTGNDGYAVALGWGVAQGSGFSPFLMVVTVLWSIFCSEYIALAFLVLLL